MDDDDDCILIGVEPRNSPASAGRKRKQPDTADDDDVIFIGVAPSPVRRPVASIPTTPTATTMPRPTLTPTYSLPVYPSSYSLPSPLPDVSASVPLPLSQSSPSIPSAPQTVSPPKVARTDSSTSYSPEKRLAKHRAAPTQACRDDHQSENRTTVSGPKDSGHSVCRSSKELQ